MTTHTAQWRADLLLAEQARIDDEIVAAVDEVRTVLGRVLTPGQRLRRELLRTQATPTVTARNLGSVIAELKRSGDIVAGRERGAPLYWKRTPSGIDAVGA